MPANYIPTVRDLQGGRVRYFWFSFKKRRARQGGLETRGAPIYPVKKTENMAIRPGNSDTPLPWIVGTSGILETQTQG